MPLSGESSSPKIRFVVALLVAVFAATVIDVVIPVTIQDIAATFSVPLGTVAQLDSLIAIASVVTALFLARFIWVFRYKSLVLIGIFFVAVCGIGLFLAPTFLVAQLAVPLNGIGSVMIGVTAETFIGNSYSLDKKAKAIGWVAAAAAFANAVSAPIVGFMTGVGGWRSVFPWFTLPVAVVSLIFVFLVFPNYPSEHRLNARKEPFMRGLKRVLDNRSAVACFIGAFFGKALGFGGAIFEVTFLRQIFSASLGFAALIQPLADLMLITIGAIAGGHLVNRVGRKRLTVVAIFWAGVSTLLSYFMWTLSGFLALRWTAAFLIGITAASSSNLTLEQVPQLRGTVMSINSAFGGVGTAVGIAIVGAVLNLFVDATTGFQAVGLTVGIFALIGAFVIFFFAKDPVRSNV